jgi:Domain of unknown function (DUF4389)
MSTHDDTAATPRPAYPATLSARLEEPLSRWLWIVKWLLLIPHYVVLIVLGIGVVIATIVAWFAILFTGRYPRGIFDFNLGVLRWMWRVSFYGYSALGTDRYPPFSLQEERDYPATLDVDYQAEHSRWRTFGRLVLAIPQLLIIGILESGGAGFTVGHGHYGEIATPWSGLIGLLALIVGFALLFTTRYLRELFDFIVGLNRWVFRVIVYVLLMSDTYPPFRYDGGAVEPGTLAGPLPEQE